MHNMHRFLKHPIVVVSAVVALIVVSIGFWYLSKPSQSWATFSPAHKMTLTEEVSASGPVTSSSAVDLALDRSGKIVRVNAQVGDTVFAGATLVALESSDLVAQLAGAQAALASQEAKLAELQKGSRPEDIAIAQTQVSNAQSALDDTHKSMADKIEDAYTKSDQAIHNTVDKLFSNPTSNPQISFLLPNSQLENELENDRLMMESVLVSWSTSIDNGGATAPDAKKNLELLRNFLSEAASALADAIPSGQTSQTVIESWRVEVATARTNLNTAYAAITAGEDAARIAESALKTAQNQLALKQAGSTPEQIAAQQAVVDGAKASVSGAEAQLAKTVLRAPITGIVTRQNAHVGAVASLNTPLVSMISNAAFQVEVSVSEAEVAKIQPGNAVSVTLDAYGSGVTFAATVASVDPAATVTNGASSYRVVIQFKEKDQRIKTGMTANVDIVTAHKDDALAIPWNSVIERGGKSIITVKNTDGSTSEREIQTGIRSHDEVEVVSGLQEGELVASYGTHQ